MAIRLPQTKLVPGGAYRQIAENSMSKPPTEGVVPGSSLREMVTPPIIGGEPAGSQKVFSVRPEVNPAANLTSPAAAGGPANVVPAAPAYVPPAPGAGLPTVEEAQSIIRDAISGVTGAPSAVASSMAPSSAPSSASRGSVMGATAPVGNLKPVSASASMASPSVSRPGGVTPLNNPGGGGNMPGRNILGSPVIGSTGGANAGGGGSLFPEAAAVATGIGKKIVTGLSELAPRLVPAASEILGGGLRLASKVAGPLAIFAENALGPRREFNIFGKKIGFGPKPVY